MTEPSRYRLLRRLASGGMAEVWEAATARDDRVAIKKILPGRTADPAARRMFSDEASIASRLDHPNVVRVLDWGFAENAEFIAFELVDGLDGRRALSMSQSRNDAIPEPVALHVVGEVARALEHAHGIDVVHRDVSPSNVLLSWDGRVLLSDFGIAHAADRLERTATGQVKGKESYMAPEQAMARGAVPATDVYALGVTLVVLLVGEPPLSSWPRITRRFAGGPLALPPLLGPDVSTLVRACMELEPDARPSARDVAERAAALAQRELREDPREALRRWLGPLRAEVERVGSLDHLMSPLHAATTSETREVTLTRPD